MTTVFLRQLNFYDASSVLSALRALVDAMGGMGQFVSPGERVLLKPNLLSAEPPDRCVPTHPEIVRAVARLVLEAGGRIRGFLYFPPLPEGAARYVFEADLVDANTGEGFATVSIPFLPPEQEQK